MIGYRRIWRIWDFDGLCSEVVMLLGLAVSQRLGIKLFRQKVFVKWTVNDTPFVAGGSNM